MFLGHTVFEKNAMLSCKNSKLQNCPNFEFFVSWHHIFLEYCVSEKQQIWSEYSLFYIIYKNVLDNKRIQKNIALQYLKCQNCLLGQFCN